MTSTTTKLYIPTVTTACGDVNEGVLNKRKIESKTKCEKDKNKLRV
jgi:hypothetical protein